MTLNIRFKSSKCVCVVDVISKMFGGIDTSNRSLIMAFIVFVVVV